MGLSPFFYRVRAVWLDLLALLWPTECVGCGAPDRDLCDACGAALARRAASTPLLCGSVPEGAGAAGTARPPPIVPLFAAAPYVGMPRELLIALKHAGRVGFARRLGLLLARPLSEALAAAEACDGDAASADRSASAGRSASFARSACAPLIVCVPSRSARVRQRGYRHVEEILRHTLRQLRSGRGDAGGGERAEGTSTAFLLPRRPLRALRPLAGRTGQVGLTSSQRVRNAQRIAIRSAARRRLSGRRVVIVDDVVTTGATIAAACEAVREAGAEVFAAVAICRVERRDTRDADAGSGSGSAR